MKLQRPQRNYFLPLVMGMALLPLLTACHPALMSGTRRAFSMGESLKAAIHNPFRTVDSDALTRAKAAIALENFRVRPSSTVLGKREFCLTECRGLALGNNLELQAARLEQLSQSAIEYSNKTRLLPHFLISGELSQRDNYAYSYSDVLGEEGRAPNPGAGGAGVTNYSVSHERNTRRFVLEGRWSPTDAALAYYLTKSSGNDEVKAHYRKVRVAQKLIAVVDSAFYRLLSLQRCMARAQNLAHMAAGIEDKMGEAFKRKLIDLPDYNRARERRIRADRLLQKIRNGIERQRNILASAMGVSPDYCADGGFVLVGDMKPPSFWSKFCDLEMMALQHRPEAFEAGLNHLNSINDLKRTWVKYFPKVTGFGRYTYDTDRYLREKNWKEGGVLIYFDFTDWLANASESKAAGLKSAKTDKEMGSVAIAIASQVRTAALNYFDSLDQLHSAERSLKGSREVMLASEERAARDDLGRLTAEEAKADSLEDVVERVRSIGEANATLAELYGAMGTNYTEPKPCN